MSKQLRMKMKRAIAGIVMITTIVWLSGVMALVPVAKAATIVDGDVIKNPSAAGLAQFDVYIVKLVGTKKFKRLVLNPQVFASYGHLSWSNVKSVDQTTMDSYTTSGLVRVDGDAAQKVYALAPSGDTGSKSWVNVTATQFVTDAGADSDSVYTINSTDAGNYTAVADITTVNDVKTFLSAGTLPSTVVVTGAVTVALASDNPAAGTVISDDTTGVMQNSAPVLKITVTNGNSTEVKVNTLKLTRTGIAADADINNLYLYDGSTKIAEMSSVSSKIFTFNSSSGLFAVPANGSKTILVGVNVATGVTTAKTLGFSIASAADVVLSAGSVTGSFPINSNQLTTAAVTDLGYINLTNTTTFPATIDPSSTSQELWRFTATANSQKMTIKKIVLTMVGTIATGDIQNLKLTVGGVQVGSTASIDSSNKVTFDLSAAPYEILSGQNKVFVLMGEVIKGTGRAFKFTIRSTADLVSKDGNYGVDTTPLSGGAALTVVDPDASGDGTNINNGTLTISRSANSPSGNIAAGMIDQVLARFDYKAAGEDIKVSYVRVSVDTVSSIDTSDTLDNGKLYFNGSQVGTTDVEVADVTENAFSLGNTVVVPAGTTGVFEYRADTTTNAGTALAAEDTITVSLNAGTTDATGQTSLTNVSTAAASGLLLTVKTGALSRAKNTAMADATTVTPTGVIGAVGVKVASLVLTAGSGEAVNLTQVVVGDDPGVATSDFGANFQNLTLKNGSTVIAPVQGTLSTTEGADYTFSLSPSVQINAGAQYVIDIYADILTGATGYAAAEPGLEFVSASATGVNTGNNAASALTVLDLHNIVIASQGSLVITANASTPVAGQLVMGDTDVVLAMLDFTAGSSEDVNVSVITITDTTNFGGSLSNLKLYDGTTPLGTVAALDAQTNGVATFNLTSNWTIPKNTAKVLTVKGSVNAYGSAVSGGSHTLNLASNANVTTRGAQSGAAITETVTSATGTAQKVYRTKVIVDRASSSPSGTAVAGAGASVLEFNVAANSAYAAILNAVALTISGAVDVTGTGNANLYKSTDTVTALATETHKQDLVSVSAAVTGQSLAVTGSSGDWNGIPIGATVLVNDTSVSSTAVLRGIVTAVSATVLTATVVGDISGYAGIDVGVTYAPLQPGVGKLFFGAQTTLTADEADASTSLDVTSTDGFAIGDTVKVAGYTSTGVAVAWESGCAVTAIPDATHLTTSACQFVDDTTIDFDYLSEAATAGYGHAITNNQNSAAVVYTGLVNTTGQTVSAGTTMTFVVKGDTTGATSNETLRADIAAVGDLNWDDQVNYGITTVTKNLPVTGGTLSY